MNTNRKGGKKEGENNNMCSVSASADTVINKSTVCVQFGLKYNNLCAWQMSGKNSLQYITLGHKTTTFFLYPGSRVRSRRAVSSAIYNGSSSISEPVITRCGRHHRRHGIPCVGRRYRVTLRLLSTNPIIRSTHLLSYLLLSTLSLRR